jgi:hypothetical protein
VNYGVVYLSKSLMELNILMDQLLFLQRKLQYFTPILEDWIIKNFMFLLYTYSYIAGAVKFDNGGYHQ